MNETQEIQNRLIDAFPGPWEVTQDTRNIWRMKLPVKHYHCIIMESSFCLTKSPDEVGESIGAVSVFNPNLFQNGAYVWLPHMVVAAGDHIECAKLLRPIAESFVENHREITQIAEENDYRKVDLWDNT